MQYNHLNPRAFPGSVVRAQGICSLQGCTLPFFIQICYVTITEAKVTASMADDNKQHASNSIKDRKTSPRARKSFRVNEQTFCIRINKLLEKAREETPATIRHKLELH